MHQLVNTIILNWVGAVICQHMTHSADENSKKGNSFQTQSYGLNAIINAPNNPGLNHPLHSYYSPKLRPRLIQANSQQQVSILTLQGGSNKSLTW